MSSSPSAHRSTGDFGHTSLERNTDSYIQGEKVISRLLNGHTSNQDAANLLSTYPSYILSALGWKVRSNIASEYASATIGVSETSTDVTRQSPEEWLPVLATKYSRYAHVAHLTQDETLLSYLVTFNQQVVTTFSVSIRHQILRDLTSQQHTSHTKEYFTLLGLEPLWRNYVNEAVHALIKSKVSVLDHENLDVDDDTLPMSFEEGALSPLTEWLHDSVIPVLRSWDPINISPLVSQSQYELHFSLGRLRARQLFDIISDFPASSPALQDLISCSEEFDLKPYISAQLGTALQTRLLHPGASTQDIIQFYTYLIRSLRFVDPSGVILSHVIGPVRTYLRARSDTVPVIVASLLGKAGTFTLLRDLMRESTNAPGLGGGGDTSMALYDEEDESTVEVSALDESKRLVFIPPPDEDWAPRPTDAGPDYRQSRKSDVVAIIASIFEDEEGFIAALEKSCADQFLKIRDYNISEEYETNENLKKRFGDSWLARCDVMLNDIKKSQRYDRSIHHLLLEANDDLGRSTTLPLHPLILSRQFWPALKDEGTAAPSLSAAGGGEASSKMFSSMPSTSSNARQSTDSSNKELALEAVIADMEMPGQFSKALERYAAQFAKLAHSRRIRWLPGRGEVHIRLRMDDGRTIDEHVNALQASVIELASNITKSGDKEDKSEPLVSSLTVQEVAARLRVDEQYVNEAFGFWVSRNVLREHSPGHFSVMEHM